jgi:hypothetical protein
MPKKQDEVDVRGEITVPLDGQEYVLRPSFEAVSRIERELGRGLYDLANLALVGRLSFSDMGVIIAEMMHAYGKSNPDDPLNSTYRAATAQRMSELVFEHGGPSVMARVAVVLVGALSGGYTSSGEVKAATG